MMKLRLRLRIFSIGNNARDFVTINSRVGTVYCIRVVPDIWLETDITLHIIRSSPQEWLNIVCLWASHPVPLSLHGGLVQEDTWPGAVRSIWDCLGGSGSGSGNWGCSWHISAVFCRWMLTVSLHWYVQHCFRYIQTWVHLIHMSSSTCIGQAHMSMPVVFYSVWMWDVLVFRAGITAAISRGLLDINHSIQMTCVMMIMRMRMTMSKICILSQSHLPSSCSPWYRNTAITEFSSFTKLLVFIHIFPGSSNMDPGFWCLAWHPDWFEKLIWWFICQWGVFFVSFSSSCQEDWEKDEDQDDKDDSKDDSRDNAKSLMEMSITADDNDGSNIQS